MHSETATELSVLRQWILVFSAECEGHCQILSLASYGGLLFCSDQGFRIFIFIAGVSEMGRANYIFSCLQDPARF